MKVHQLKAHPDPFEAMWQGDKPYDIRKNDRDFKRGDVTVQREVTPASVDSDPADVVYTGREIRARITYMSAGGTWGLPDHICVLGLLIIERRER